MKTYGNKLIYRLYPKLIAAVAILIGLICLLPLIHIVALSLSNKNAAISGLVTFWPVDFTLASYEYLLDDSRFLQSFTTSVLRVVLGVSISLIITILMAYPLAQEKKDFPARDKCMWFVIFAMLFGGSLVPWYFVIKQTGLLNTIWALVIPCAVQPYNVILLMNFFRNQPKAIKESAKIDGASEWMLFLKICLPLATPAVATITLFVMVYHWNSFFDGMLLINSPEKVPLQTYIQSLVVRTENLSNTDSAQLIRQMSQRTFNSAKIVVSTIPILIVYPIMQKYFVTGITLGSVKE